MTSIALQIPHFTLPLWSRSPGGQTVIAVLLFFLALGILATAIAGGSPVSGGVETVPVSLAL